MIFGDRDSDSTDRTIETGTEVVSLSDTTENSVMLPWEEVKCFGSFQNKKFEVTLQDPEKPVLVTRTPEPSKSMDEIIRTCQHLSTVVGSENEMDWDNVEKILMPNLTTFDLYITTNEKNPESDYFTKIGFEKLLFYDKSSVSENLWRQGVLFRISVNDHMDLRFFPYTEHASIWIDQIQDPMPILDTYDPPPQLKLKSLSIFNATLKSLDKINPEYIGLLNLENVQFTNVIQFLQQCKSLETLTLALTNYVSIDLQTILNSDKIYEIQIQNASLSFTKSETKKFEHFEKLYLKGCQMNESFEENAWDSFPNLTKLAVVPGPNDPRPNTEFLQRVLNKLEHIIWIYFTNFDWTTSNHQVQNEMSNFVKDTKGKLNGKEENFILRRIDETKWFRGWSHEPKKSESLKDLEYLSNYSQEQEEYKINNINLDLEKFKVKQKSRYDLQTYVGTLDLGELFLGNDKILSITEALKESRNISLTLDRNILLKVEHGVNDVDKALSISKIDGNQILKMIGSTNQNLTKLSVSHFELKDFSLLQKQLQRGTLRELSVIDIDFKERDVDITKIIKECDELNELVLYNHYPQYQLDLGMDLKSAKTLRRLALNGANLTLSSQPPNSPFNTLEEFYIFSSSVHPSVIQNFTKLFINLKRIGIGSNTWDVNSIFLKSILNDLKNIEWIYFHQWNSTSNNRDVDLEMEKFIFKSEGDLLGDEKGGFILGKGANGKWKGWVPNSDNNESDIIKFNSLRYENIYQNIAAFKEYDF